MMNLNTSFTGRIIQVTEALDFGDAVSNQVIALDQVFKSFGLRSEVYSQWHHEKVAQHRRNLDLMEAREGDVVIMHFCGLSDYALPAVLNSNATRVLLTHNITPASFFDRKTDLHAYCLRGRKQLAEVWSKFHFFWGDSAYNLEELIELGAPPQRCDVVPIIVPAIPQDPCEVSREPGSWLFVGRVAPNKQHVELVDLFAAVRAQSPAAATHLYLVGGYAVTDPYYERLRARISTLGLNDCVTLTGKVPDEERDSFYFKANVLVSLSQHEGFGVPLVEAPLRGMPVVALDTTAVGETVGVNQALAKSAAEIADLVVRTITDPVFASKLLDAERQNALRFRPDTVAAGLQSVLMKILPQPGRYRTVSVVICTYNRRDYLERVFDYLQYQSTDQFEVVVVDGPSDDGTKELLEHVGDRIKVAHNAERNLSKSRNLGIELAAGDVVAFIDDDAIPFDDWVARILEQYNVMPVTVAGLGGPTYFAGSLKFQATDIGFNRRAEVVEHIDPRRVGKDGWYRSLLGTNSTFTRAALEACDGFDEQYDYFLDESDVCWRVQQANQLIAYNDQMFLRHEFAQSANRLSKYNFNWFAICKNTAYFISAFSGLKGRELVDYLRGRLERERVLPLDEAVRAGEITKSERDAHVDRIWTGMEQGLADFRQHFPRRRKLRNAGIPFHPYSCRAGRLRVGVDLPRLHICIITKEFPPFAGTGGIGTLYYHLASELLLMGHEVTVIAPGDQRSELQQGRLRVIFAIKQDVKFEDLDGGFRTNMEWSMSALAAVQEVHAIHPVHVVESALWDTEALALSMVPRHARPPVVVRLVTPFPVAARTNGWQVPERIAGFFKSAERNLIAHADALVPISSSIARTIQAEYNLYEDRRWHEVPCGIAYWPSFDFRHGYASEQGLDKLPSKVLESRKLIVFVGRLEQRKGVDLLLTAAGPFLREEPQAQLVLAGRDIEGWGQRINELVSQDLRDRVHLLGEVDDVTREKLLARAYCVAFPSRYESFGLVPLEAFVHGTPVVGSASGAVPEVVTDDAGILFKPGDADSLAHAIIKLLKNPAMRDRLAVGARRRVRTLSSRTMAERSVRLYATLC